MHARKKKKSKNESDNGDVHSEKLSIAAAYTADFFVYSSCKKLACIDLNIVIGSLRHNKRHNKINYKHGKNSS